MDTTYTEIFKGITYTVTVRGDLELTSTPLDEGSVGWALYDKGEWIDGGWAPSHPQAVQDRIGKAMLPIGRARRRFKFLEAKGEVTIIHPDGRTETVQV